jgi:hypothetical protein
LSWILCRRETARLAHGEGRLIRSLGDGWETVDQQAAFLTDGHVIATGPTLAKPSVDHTPLGGFVLPDRKPVTSALSRIRNARQPGADSSFAPCRQALRSAWICARILLGFRARAGFHDPLMAGCR